MNATTAIALSLLTCLGACGACENVEPSETVMYPPDALPIPLGQLRSLGGAKIGYKSWADAGGRPAAVLGTASADPALSTTPWTTTVVARGELLPAFGAIYRLIDVNAQVAVVTLEDPAQSRALFQRQDSLLLAPRGHLAMPGTAGQPMAYFELVKVVETGGRKLAVLETWPDLPKVSVLPGQIVTVTVGEGDLLEGGGRSYRVLSVQAANAEAQLPAWVEIDSRRLESR